jgi:hypothetical protein
MKKLIGLVLAISLVAGCTEKDDKKDQELLLLALLAGSVRGGECNVSFSFGGRTRQSGSPLTIAEADQEVEVRFGNVPVVNHKIATIRVDAEADQILTVEGTNYFPIFFQKDGDCPLTSEDYLGVVADITQLTVNPDVTQNTGNDFIENTGAEITFNQAGRYYVVFYIASGSRNPRGEFKVTLADSGP